MNVDIRQPDDVSVHITVRRRGGPSRTITVRGPHLTEDDVMGTIRSAFGVKKRKATKRRKAG
jgi:hypothetical protein